MIREETEQILKNAFWKWVDNANPDKYLSVVAQILSLITTEIEKVELPKYKKSWTSDGEKFEDCLAPVAPEDTRQSILNLLKEQK